MNSFRALRNLKAKETVLPGARTSGAAPKAKAKASAAKGKAKKKRPVVAK